MLPGECKGMDGVICKGEGDGGPDDLHGTITLELQVCKSNAGWYLGYWCPKCGPYSRESGYFPTEAAATAALEKDPKAHARTPGFNPAGLELQIGDPDSADPDYRD